MTLGISYRAIDPKLIVNGFEEQMLLVLMIACFCIVNDLKQRPNRKDVRCIRHVKLRSSIETVCTKAEKIIIRYS
ncbi:hypothetical protein SAY86_024713 [Trapa natans]|uniref:Uncharacterized protein n=1 Tax=Trapa natans TaxID=22666 RepID=A0AAN7LZP6_TRANT|nr:hypothetical protein SAY86_024713 [Trapa natans]